MPSVLDKLMERDLKDRGLQSPFGQLLGPLDSPEPAPPTPSVDNASLDKIMEEDLKARGLPSMQQLQAEQRGIVTLIEQVAQPQQSPFSQPQAEYERSQELNRQVQQRLMQPPPQGEINELETPPSWAKEFAAKWNKPVSEAIRLESMERYLQEGKYQVDVGGKSLAHTEEDFKEAFPQDWQALWTSTTSQVADRPQTFGEKIKGSIVGGTVMVGKGVLGTMAAVQDVSEQIAESILPVTEQQRKTPAVNLYSDFKQGIEKWEQENLAVMARKQPERFTEYFSNPSNILFATTDALPLLGTSTLAGLAVGPLGPFLVAGAVEGDAAAEEVRRGGGSEKSQWAARLLVGVPNGLLEMAQVGRIFQGIGPAQIQTIKTTMRKSLLAQARTVIRGGKKLSTQAVKTWVEGATEEGLQTINSEVMSALLSRRQIDRDQLKQDVMNAMFGGGFAELGLAGISTAVQQGRGRQAVRSQQSQQIAQDLQQLIASGVSMDDALAAVAMQYGGFRGGFAATPKPPPKPTVAEVAGEGKALKATPTEHAALSKAADLASGLTVGKEIYVSPQWRFTIKGKEQLVNSGEFLRAAGLEPAEQLNRWRKPTVAELAEKARPPVVAEDLGLEAPLTAKEKRPSFEQFAQGIGVTWEELSGPERNLDTLAATREAYEAQYPSIPRTKQPAKTVQQKALELGMRQREVGRQEQHRLEQLRKKWEVRALSEQELGKQVSTVSALVKYAKTHAEAVEAKAFKSGWAEGQADVVQTHKQLVDFAKLVLPKSELGKIVGAVAKAENPLQIRQAAQAINRVAANYARSQAIVEFEETRKTLKLKYLTGQNKANAEALLDSFTQSVPSHKTLARMQSLLDAVEGGEQDIPDALISRAKDVLARAGNTPLKQLDPTGIRAVSAAIQNIVHAQETKNRLYFGGKARAADEAISLATAEVDEWTRISPARKGKPPKQFTVSEAEAGKYDSDRRQNPLVKLQTSDRLSHNTRTMWVAGTESVTRKILYDNLQKADDDMMRVKYNVEDEIRPAFEGVTSKDIRKWSSAANKPIGRFGETLRTIASMEHTRTRADIIQVDLPTATTPAGAKVPTLDMTVAEMMLVYANSTDPSTKAELLRNKQDGITFNRSKGRNAVKLRGDDLRAITAHLEQNYPQGKGIVDAGKAAIGPDSVFGKELQRAHLEEEGWALPMHEGYMPRMRDSDYRIVEPEQMLRTWRNRIYENLPMLQSRGKTGAPLVIDDFFSVYNRHINLAAAYIGKAQATNDAMRLLEDRGFQNMVKNRFRYGSDVLDDMTELVRQFRGLDYRPQSSLEQFLRRQIPRLHRGQLGLKPHIVAYQTVSYLTASNEIDLKYLRGHKWILPTKANKAEISKLNPYLRTRFEGSGHGILTPSAGGESLLQFFVGDKGGLMDKSVELIHEADSAVIVNIYQAAKAELADKGYKGDDLNQRAADRAAQITRSTQPTWNLLDISTVARVGKQMPIVKLIASMYSSQRDQNVNMVARAVIDYTHGPRDFKARKELAQKALVPTVVSGTLIHAINRLWKLGLAAAAGALLGREREKEPLSVAEESWGAAKRVLGNWVFTGDIIAAAGERVKQSWQKGRGWQADFPENPLTGPINDVYDLIGHTNEAIQAKVEAKDERATQQTWKAIESFIRAASSLGGIPAAGPMDIYKTAKGPPPKKSKLKYAPP